MISVSREKEIVQLSTEYGTPLRQRHVLDVNQQTYDFWKAHKRFGEVVLFIRRHNGNIILHTKSFYPAGALRVPSGTILEQESLLDAVYRETREETGLQVCVERFLAVLEFEFNCQGYAIYIPSYLFLLRELQGKLQVQDVHERIAAFSEVPLTALHAVAERLETLPSEWQDWGRFRGIPHRVAAELLNPTGRATPGDESQWNEACQKSSMTSSL